MERERVRFNKILINWSEEGLKAKKKVLMTRKEEEIKIEKEDLNRSKNTRKKLRIYMEDTRENHMIRKKAQIIATDHDNLTKRR